LFAKLLNAPYRSWRDVINDFYEGRSGHLEDDPIPEAIQTVLESDDIDVCAAA
jgi:hypothetical protein